MHGSLIRKAKAIFEEHVSNERGQTEIVTWAIVLLLLWYMFTSAGLLVQ